MKWMVASDIHGSAYYAEKMFESFKREEADRLILVGDLLYHGPRNDLPRDYNPKAVIEMLNQHKKYILAVRGNCDTEVDQMVLDFPILADYAIVTVDNNCGGNRVIYVTHGHKYNEDNPLTFQKNDIMLNGHTHIPKCKEHETFVYMNPGSVSIPKGNSEHSYLCIEQGRCEWKNLEGETFMVYNL